MCPPQSTNFKDDKIFYHTQHARAQWRPDNVTLTIQLSSSQCSSNVDQEWITTHRCFFVSDVYPENGVRLQFLFFSWLRIAVFHKHIATHERNENDSTNKNSPITHRATHNGWKLVRRGNTRSPSRKSQRPTCRVTLTRWKLWHPCSTRSFFQDLHAHQENKSKAPILWLQLMRVCTVCKCRPALITWRKRVDGYKLSTCAHKSTFYFTIYSTKAFRNWPKVILLQTSNWL